MLTIDEIRTLLITLPDIPSEGPRETLMAYIMREVWAGDRERVEAYYAMAKGLRSVVTGAIKEMDSSLLTTLLEGDDPTFFERTASRMGLLKVTHSEEQAYQSMKDGAYTSVAVKRRRC